MCNFKAVSKLITKSHQNLCSQSTRELGNLEGNKEGWRWGSKWSLVIKVTFKIDVKPNARKGNSSYAFYLVPNVSVDSHPAYVKMKKLIIKIKQDHIYYKRRTASYAVSQKKYLYTFI